MLLSFCCLGNNHWEHLDGRHFINNCVDDYIHKPNFSTEP